MSLDKKQGTLSSERVLRKFAEATRYFGRIPASDRYPHVLAQSTGLPWTDRPSANHFGNKAGLVVNAGEVGARERRLRRSDRAASRTQGARGPRSADRGVLSTFSNQATTTGSVAAKSLSAA